MSDSLSATTIDITGAGGEAIPAYLARPDGDGQRGGVVVIHHMPGYDRGSKEITRRFAELGYDAICPNLHHHDAPGAAPDDAAAASRAAGGVPDERLLGDVSGAIDHLRALPTSIGKVGVIGYCSGGRQTVLVACNLDVDAAVDCYGAYVTGTPPAEFPLKITNLVEQLPTCAAHCWDCSATRTSTLRRRTSTSSRRSSRATRRATRSTATTTRDTRSSAPTGRPMASPPPTTAGSGSRSFSSKPGPGGLTCARI